MLLVPPAALQSPTSTPSWQGLIGGSWQSQCGLQSSALASQSRVEKGESGAEDNDVTDTGFF